MIIFAGVICLMVSAFLTLVAGASLVDDDYVTFFLCFIIATLAMIPGVYLL